jgi:hypothetical protein
VAYLFISPLWTEAWSLTAPVTVSLYTRKACTKSSSIIGLLNQHLIQYSV